MLFHVKTSIDLPDELYRRVKARSALGGRAVREVAPAPGAGWLDQWAALGARVAKATAPRTAGTKRGGASTKGAKKRPKGLVGQLERDRR